MAALVVDGWAGAENFEKELCDQPTNGWIGQWTDRRDGPTATATKNYL